MCPDRPPIFSCVPLDSSHAAWPTLSLHLPAVCVLGTAQAAWARSLATTLRRAWTTRSSCRAGCSGPWSRPCRPAGMRCASWQRRLLARSFRPRSRSSGTTRYVCLLFVTTTPRHPRCHQVWNEIHFAFNKHTAHSVKSKQPLPNERNFFESMWRIDNLPAVREREFTNTHAHRVATNIMLILMQARGRAGKPPSNHVPIATGGYAAALFYCAAALPQLSAARAGYRKLFVHVGQALYRVFPLLCSLRHQHHSVSGLCANIVAVCIRKPSPPRLWRLCAQHVCTSFLRRPSTCCVRCYPSGATLSMKLAWRLFSSSLRYFPACGLRCTATSSWTLMCLCLRYACDGSHGCTSGPALFVASNKLDKSHPSALFSMASGSWS